MVNTWFDRFSIIIVLSILVVFVAVGCSNDLVETDIGSQTSFYGEDTMSESNVAEPSVLSYKNYSCYDLIVDSEFDKKMNTNLIDAQYQNDLENSTTTQDLLEIEKSLNDRWKQELNYACNNLEKHLHEDDIIEFEKIQKQWEESIITAYDFDNEILRADDKYGIQLGNSFGWQWIANITNEYRSRTIHVKYLTYLFENQKDCAETTWDKWLVNET